MKALENSVVQSLLREEQALEEGSPTISDDVASLRRALKELKAKHEVRVKFVIEMVIQCSRARRRPTLISFGRSRRMRS